MSYQSELETLAELSGAQAVAAYEAWAAGTITTETFVAILASYVAGANSQAAALADVGLAAAISVALGVPQPTLGLLPPTGDAERLYEAATTLARDIDATPDPRARVERLGRAEPLHTAAVTFSEGMKRSGKVTGWVRGMDSDPCTLCQWWWRDGRVWPADHEMPTHTGCSCVPVPTIADHIKPLYTDRRRTA